ncbi:MAG: cysteine--tRNA ligase [Lentisphaeria bacterium]|nr:cysteine--tRNA ligase [Lentisphaeria bacterium]
MRFYNTLGRTLEEFTPIEKDSVRMYTCGPTVYNYAHIGNFRAYLFEDILRRTLEYSGYKVTQVMNLTDVDDKTIRDSKAAGLKLQDFTRKYKDAFFEDLKTLRIEPAAVYPEATTHIAEMQAMIQVLFEKGYAYKSEDGSVYFSIDKFKEYGQLARIDREQQRAGVRINSDEYEKDSVADFALWKAWSENDGDVKWSSPWGEGRPGWHLECSAMSMKYLGKTFDIHTGGVDNMFPHHEDEIAQSEAANGCKFVNYWLHCEHLTIENKKMSKSLGNFYTLRDLLAKGYTGPEVRWALIGTHYRSKLNFSIKLLDEARASLKKFSDFFGRLRDLEKGPAGKALAQELVEKARKDFAAGIGNDLGIAEALAAVYTLQRAVNSAMAKKELQSEAGEIILEEFRSFNKVLGSFDVDQAAAPAEEIPQEVLALAEERTAARKAKDFQKADALRDQLKALGYVVEDVPGGGIKVKKI